MRVDLDVCVYDNNTTVGLLPCRQLCLMPPSRFMMTISHFIYRYSYGNTSMAYIVYNIYDYTGTTTTAAERTYDTSERSLEK